MNIDQIIEMAILTETDNGSIAIAHPYHPQGRTATIGHLVPTTGERWTWTSTDEFPSTPDVADFSTRDDAILDFFECLEF